MDFKQLNAFLTISSELNFTKAAEKLGYAQSSISAQIQQLEAELGIPLFERIGKTVSLTHAGAQLVPYATQILQLSVDMKSIASNTAVPAGTLTIGTAESLSISRLPVLLKKYRELFPLVDIRLMLLNCSEFMHHLSNHVIDVAFALGDRMQDEHLIEELCLPEPVDVLACPGHPLTQKQKVYPIDFKDASFLLTGTGCNLRSAFTGFLSEEKVVPKIALETDSIQAIKQAAMSGLGICVLPRISVKDEVAAGKLIPLNIKIKDFGIVSQLLYHKNKWRSPALNAFIGLSKQMFM